MQIWRKRHLSTSIGKQMYGLSTWYISRWLQNFSYLYFTKVVYLVLNNSGISAGTMSNLSRWPSKSCDAEPFQNSVKMCLNGQQGTSRTFLVKKSRPPAFLCCPKDPHNVGNIKSLEHTKLLPKYGFPPYHIFCLK